MRTKIAFETNQKCSLTVHTSRSRGVMNIRKNYEAAKQLTRCFGLNGGDWTPFVMYYCGIDPETLLRNIATIQTKPLPIKIHQEDVGDLFPTEKSHQNAPKILHKHKPKDYIISH